VQGRHRYDRLRPEPAPAPDGHYYEELRRTQQRVDAPQRVADTQSRQTEPKFSDAQEAIEARHAAYAEILKERCESGKINASEASRAMFNFEYDGSLKYKDQVIARMWQHRELQETREIAAEVRSREQAERDRERGEMER
jgi:hypothetical protein